MGARDQSLSSSLWSDSVSEALDASELVPGRTDTVQRSTNKYQFSFSLNCTLVALFMQIYHICDSILCSYSILFYSIGTSPRAEYSPCTHKVLANTTTQVWYVCISMDMTTLLNLCGHCRETCDRRPCCQTGVGKPWPGGHVCRRRNICISFIFSLFKDLFQYRATHLGASSTLIRL